MLQLKKIPFYCFSAPTLIPQAIKKVAAMKGLARAPGVIGGQQLVARAGERLEKEKIFVLSKPTLVQGHEARLVGAEP